MTSDHGIHSHNSLRAMYYYVGKIQACNEFDIAQQTGTVDGPTRMVIFEMRAVASRNLADAAFNAVVGGMIEQGDGYGH